MHRKQFSLFLHISAWRSLSVCRIYTSLKCSTDLDAIWQTVHFWGLMLHRVMLVSLTILCQQKRAILQPNCHLSLLRCCHLANIDQYLPGRFCLVSNYFGVCYYCQVCWVIQSFSELHYSDSVNEQHVIDTMRSLLHCDKDVPVRLEAAIALQMLLKHQQSGNSHVMCPACLSVSFSCCYIVTKQLMIIIVYIIYYRLLSLTNMD